MHIGASRDEKDRLTVTIRNPVPPETPGDRRQGNRMAQDNVRERMRAFFGEQARLETGTDTGGYWVSLIFPYQKAA